MTELSPKDVARLMTKLQREVNNFSGFDMDKIRRMVNDLIVGVRELAEAVHNALDKPPDKTT